MSEEEKTHQRINFFEQLHQQFLHLKGYGTYAYITAHAVDELYESFLTHQKEQTLSVQQHAEVNFIKSFIKSL